MYKTATLILSSMKARYRAFILTDRDSWQKDTPKGEAFQSKS
jgi:hypothetical protein